MKQIEITNNPKNLNLEKGESLIICPVCKEEYTHFDYSPKIDRPETYVSEHRGGGITIPMHCEEGHYWDLIISHHKGWSYITTDNFKQEI